MKNVKCLKCIKCGKEYEALPDATTCECGGILDVIYDYDYIRDILVKEVPQYDWRTAERYICDGIESFMGDGNITDLFTNDAWDYLSRMVSARYKEFKTDGYVDFEDKGVEEVAKEILENALRSAYELQGDDK